MTLISRIKQTLTKLLGTGSPRSKVAWLLMACVVVSLVYLPVKDATFLDYDDPQVFTENRRVQPQSLKAWLQILNPQDAIRRDAESFLPVRDLSYALDYALAGLNPTFSHLVNLVLHLLNTCLLWWLLGLVGIKKDILRVGLCLLFALHPTGVETVAWVTGRKDLLAGSFVLLVLSFLLLGTKQRLTAGMTVFWATSCLLLACFSKHSALGLTLLGVCLGYIPSFHAWRGRRPAAVAFLLCGVLVFLLSAHVEKQSGAALSRYGQSILEDSWLRHYILWAQLPLRYLSLIVWPVQPNIKYVPWRYAGLSWQYFGLIISLLLLMGGMIFLWLRWPQHRLGLCVFLLLLLPTANLVPIPNFMADRYLYLPLIGLLIWGASVLQAWTQTSGREVFVISVLTPVLLFFGWLTHNRVPTFRNDLVVWQTNIRPWQPHFIWTNLGAAQLKHERCDLALESFATALRKSPDSSGALRGRVRALYCLKDEQRLPAAIREMISRAKGMDRAQALLEAATLAGNAGQHLLAESLLVEAAGLAPEDPQIQLNLALNLANSGRLPEALDAARLAAKLDPYNRRIRRLKRRLSKELKIEESGRE